MGDSKNDYKVIKPFFEALKIALIYFFVSAIWILFTDSIVFSIFSEDSLNYKAIQTYKGIFFILITSFMIYFLSGRSFNKINKLDKTLEDKIEEIDLKTRVLKISQDEFNKTIQYLGSFDTVTGLPNRSHFENKFNDMIAENNESSFAMLYIDIDNFRQINDSFGHAAGDKLLLDLGDIIQNSTSGTNILSRITGDEFGMLLTGIKSLEEIEKKVQAVQSVIRIPWRYEGEEFYVSSTIGVSLMPKDGIEFDLLLKKANLAMQYCKINSKTGYHFYEDSIQRKVLDDAAILSDIRKGLTNNEFKLHYQIIQDLEIDKVYAAEALLRWYHPQKGYIPPLEFIPIAEKTNLIFEIREFVVTEALRQKKEWNEKGVNIPKIGVNISLRSFCDENFVEFIQNKINEYGIKRDELVLELTESGFIETMDNLHENLKRLKKLGVRISLDDYGTGYSTMARLRELSLDSIKIDKTFINNIHINKEDEAMVTGVINYAESLDLLVVAEGIETQEQMEKLKSLGCKLGQGYLIAKPMGPKELEKLIS